MDSNGNSIGTDEIWDVGIGEYNVSLVLHMHWMTIMCTATQRK